MSLRLLACQKEMLVNGVCLITEALNDLILPSLFLWNMKKRAVRKIKSTTGEKGKMGENWELLYLKNGDILPLLEGFHASPALPYYKSSTQLKRLRCDRYWLETEVAKFSDEWRNEKFGKIILWFFCSKRF
jgi:hypothetical protein